MPSFHIPKNARILPNGRTEIARHVEYGQDQRGRDRIFVGSTAFTVAEALKFGFISSERDRNATGGGLHYHPNSGVARGRVSTV